MNNNDSFNDSDEIFNLYSSKKVTETFKAQFQKLISNKPSHKSEITNTKNICTKEKENKTTKQFEEETPPLKQSTSPTDDCPLDDSIEVIGDHVPRRVTRRSARLRNKRGKTSSQCEELRISSDSDTPVVTPVVRDRRKVTRKRKTQRKKSVEEIVLLDSPQSSGVLDEDELNPEVSVKVIWQSVAIKRFQIRKFQKLSKIFEELSKTENIPEDKIMLTFNNVKVNRNDTPDSLNLQVYHFLDGGVLNKLTNNCGSSANETSNQDTNSVTLKFQDVNKKIVKLSINKNEKMKVVMIKYSEQLEIPLDKLKFFFDGELLNPSETPSSLGLENDEIIDIKIHN